MSPDVRDIVDRYFRAMQRGPDGRDELLALFADDGEYIEPFTGGTHRGPRAIRKYLDGADATAAPDLRIIVDRVEVEGDKVEVMWTCESPLFRRPARGRDTFVIREGRIRRLETALLEPAE